MVSTKEHKDPKQSHLFYVLTSHVSVLRISSNKKIPIMGHIYNDTGFFLYNTLVLGSL